jgi:hypothetical protein
MKNIALIILISLFSLTAFGQDITPATPGLVTRATNEP